MILYTDTFETPLGDMTAAATATGAICLLDYSDCWNRSEGLLQRRFGRYDTVSRKNPQNIRERLAGYFDGKRSSVAFAGLELDSGGTAFQKAVWTALRTIPYGETISYSDLAGRVESPRAVRAVGTANGRNPIAIVTPCHRVIAKDGSLAGYAGGVARKQMLLALEART